MKILMTGMGSAHCSIGDNTTFFSALYTVLSERAEVTVSEPKLSWSRKDLQSYDAVIVGLVPPTALSANKIYGALHVLDLMYESPKLRVLIDSPQVWQYKNSFASFKKNPDQIFSKIHANRKDFSIAINKHKAVAASVADKMIALPWPRTYVPLLPWGTVEAASSALGFIPTERLLGLNLDSALLGAPNRAQVRFNQWAVENIKSTWWKKVSATVRFPGRSTAITKRTKDADAESLIGESLGLIVPPQDRKVGSWWSYRYIQGLNTSTPIATYWQEARSIGDAWGVLPYQIEDMEGYERQALADSQYRQYAESIPSIEQCVNKVIQDLISSTEERENA